MTLKLPTAVRAMLYGLTLVGSPLVAWAFSHGWIGVREVDLWSAEVAVAATVAGLHLPGRASSTTPDTADDLAEVIDAPGTPTITTDDGATA